MKNQELVEKIAESVENELPAIINKIKERYYKIPDYQKGTFNQIVSDFYDRANDFRFSSWKSRLRALLMDLPELGVSLELQVRQDLSKSTFNSSITVEESISDQNDAMALSLQKTEKELQALEKQLVVDKSALTAQMEISRLNGIANSIQQLAGEVNALAEYMQMDKVILSPQPQKPNRILKSTEEDDFNTKMSDWLLEVWAELSGYVEALKEVFKEVYDFTREESDKFKVFTNFYRNPSLEHAEEVLKAAPLFKENMVSSEYELFDEIIILIKNQADKVKEKPEKTRRLIFTSLVKMNPNLQNKMRAFYDLVQRG